MEAPLTSRAVTIVDPNGSLMSEQDGLIWAKKIRPSPFSFPSLFHPLSLSLSHPLLSSCKVHLLASSACLLCIHSGVNTLVVTMELRFLSLVFLLISVTIAEDFGECYWPSGKKAPANWIKCPGQTNCCASGESCLSNSLCYQAHMNLAYRGACADQNWPSSSCPHICYDRSSQIHPYFL